MRAGILIQMTAGARSRVLDIPTEAVEEVYVGFSTPWAEVEKIQQIVGVGTGTWKLTHTDSHAYQMQATWTSISNRTPPQHARVIESGSQSVSDDPEGQTTSTTAQA